MYALIGLDANLKNVYKLAATVASGSSQVKTVDDLKDCFRDFLVTYHKDGYVNLTSDKFLVKSIDFPKIIEAFGESELNDFGQDRLIQMPTSDRSHVKATVLQALVKLRRVSPELHLLFDTVVHTIVIAPSGLTTHGRKAAGGSSSSAIGTIWISAQPDLTVDDAAELLLHELTHHLLFIDERSHAQFHYHEIIKPENQTKSAILNIKRPLDKVVHSIVVSTEILLARQSYLGEAHVTLHPESVVMLRHTRGALTEIFALPNLLNLITEHTLNILNLCQTKLNRSVQERSYELFGT